MINVGDEVLTLEEYMQDRRFGNDSRHTQIRKHVLTATRNFDNRVKEFMKHIVMSKENPMNTKLFNYRVEFQARGAGHIHGVLWIDFDQELPNMLDKDLIKSAFNKFRHDENLTEEEEAEVIKYIDTFVTCTSDKDEAKKLLLRDCGNKDAVAAKAVKIATTVNQHKHSKSCRKYKTNCRFHYPRYPSSRTIITQSPEIYYKDELVKYADDIEAQGKWLKERMKVNTEILDNVQEIIQEYDNLKPEDPALEEMKHKTIEDAIRDILITPKIQKQILPHEDIFKRYD